MIYIKNKKKFRFVLASGSDFFQNILGEDAAVYGKKYIYLFGIRYVDLISLLDFMYTGEVKIFLNIKITKNIVNFFYIF